MSTSKRTRSEKGKAPAKPSSHVPKPKNPFVNEVAEHRYINLSKRNLISGRFVVFQDLEHLDIARIMHNNSLERFVTIREKVYSPLMPYFYTNISLEGDTLYTRVLGRDIKLNLDQFASILHLSPGGVDVYSNDLQDFGEYPEGESALTASTLLHGDNNPGLVRNEVVSRYTLQSQVLAKIVFNNLLPKSGEFSHARGPVPLIIYCLLRGIKIDVPRLIASHMASEQIRLSGRSLPYGMLITRILKALDFDLSSVEYDNPSPNIDGTLLKRMEAQLRRQAPVPPPIPPPVPPPAPGPSSSSSAPIAPSDLESLISSAVRSQIEAHQAWIEQRDTAFRAEMDARYQGLRTDMTYFADSMRYMDSQLEGLYTKFNMAPPDPTTISRPLPSRGPPFPARAPSSTVPPRPRVDADDSEGADSSSSSKSDADGDQTMVAAESSSEDDDDEDDDGGAGSAE